MRVCSIATSTTVAASPLSTIVTERSSISASTRVSPGRLSKRRRLTVPVVSTTASGSIDVTRPIGTKMRLRLEISTAIPSTRGASRPVRRATTTSRTRPTWSPSGSNTGSPATRATKTRVAVLTGQG